MESFALAPLVAQTAAGMAASTTATGGGEGFARTLRTGGALPFPSGDGGGTPVREAVGRDGLPVGEFRDAIAAWPPVASGSDEPPADGMPDAVPDALNLLVTLPAVPLPVSSGPAVEPLLTESVPLAAGGPDALQPAAFADPGALPAPPHAPTPSLRPVRTDESKLARTSGERRGDVAPRLTPALPAPPQAPTPSVRPVWTDESKLARTSGERRGDVAPRPTPVVPPAAPEALQQPAAPAEGAADALPSTFALDRLTARPSPEPDQSGRAGNGTPGAAPSAAPPPSVSAPRAVPVPGWIGLRILAPAAQPSSPLPAAGDATAPAPAAVTAAPDPFPADKSRPALLRTEAHSNMPVPRPLWGAARNDRTPTAGTAPPLAPSLPSVPPAVSPLVLQSRAVAAPAGTAEAPDVLSPAAPLPPTSSLGASAQLLHQAAPFAAGQVLRQPDARPASPPNPAGAAPRPADFGPTSPGPATSRATASPSDSAAPPDAAIPTDVRPVFQPDAQTTGVPAASALPRADGASAAGVPAAHAADPTAIVRDVAAQLASGASKSDGHQIELTLSPAELGRVRLLLSAEGTTATLTVTADRPETLDLIRGGIEILTRDLRDLGYSSVSFELRSGAGTSPDTGPAGPAEKGTAGLPQLGVSGGGQDGVPDSAFRDRPAHSGHPQGTYRHGGERRDRRADHDDPAQHRHAHPTVVSASARLDLRL